MLEPILVLQDFNTLSLEDIRSRYRNMDITDQSGKTLLFYAVQSGRMDIFNLFLSKAIRISARDDSGETVIYECIRRQNFKMLLKLISLGLRLNNTNDHGKTPLHLAAESGNIEIIQVVLENGGLFKKDIFGKTPLHDAVLNGKLDALKWLKNKINLSLHSKTNDGYTCLHLAATRFNIDLIKYLIKSGLDVNALTNFYDTPLHFAVRHKNYEAISLLLKNMSFINIKNKIGVYAIDESGEDNKIKDLIEKHSYDPAYQDHLRKFQMINSILNRDRKEYLKLKEDSFIEKTDIYGKKSSDYIKEYRLEKKFK